MNFLDYDRLISIKKKAIIDSYVKQYGEGFRKLIEDSFNNIRFCFFETPKRIRDYVNEKSFKDGKQITIKFLEELGFDISTIYDDFNFSISSSNEILDRILRAFFPTFHYMTLMDMDNGIFSYFNGSEIKKSLFKQSLAGINLPDEEIRKILSILEKYKREYLNLYNPLLKYADELDKKIDNLMEQYEKNGRKTEQDKAMLKYEFAKLCIINNFDLDEFEIGDVDFKNLYLKNLNITIVKAAAKYVKNKKGQYVSIVYFSPLDKDYEFLDTFLDHEIRHAIEYSINGNIRKCGIQLENLDSGEIKYEYLNEVMTQKLSIESTYERQKRGIYIFLDQKKYTGVHVDYDEYLDVITNHFPSGDAYNCFVQSRLMKNLDGLYKYYSDEELMKINSKIMPEVQEIKKR